MYKQNASRIPFLNIYVDNLTMDEALDAICDLAQQDRCAYVLTPNVNHLVTIEADEEFRQLYKAADLILTDGMPLVWLSRVFRQPIKEKVSGSDLFPLLAKRAAEEGLSMFFLGAMEGVAQKAADILMDQNPGLKIAGTYSPPLGFEDSPEEVQAILEIIRNADPDILILGLGSPKQEKFLYQYRQALNVPVSLGLGASFDFVAGTVKRSPKWMSDHGLEWVYRISQEPRRLTKRYFFDFIDMFPLLWKYRSGSK